MKTNKIIIIAEAGVNHNGNLEVAKQLIKNASIAGADIIKFQSFTSEKLTTKSAKIASYQIINSDSNDSQFELLKKLELNKENFYEIKSYCDELNIEFCSTAFDVENLNFLLSLGIKRIKIPSGEITNLELLKYISSLNLPVIMSTGMSNIKEILDAYDILTQGNLKKSDITILHCNSAYPTPLEDVNLMAMFDIKSKTGAQIGFSDHTLGIEVPIAAAALGATIIEKHFTLDRSFLGPDHKSSLEPHELSDMIKSIRNVEQALGNGIKEPQPSEKNNKNIVRKSLVASKEIKIGEKFTRDNITAKRPGNGLSPMLIEKIIGEKAKKNFVIDELITL